MGRFFRNFEGSTLRQFLMKKHVVTQPNFCPDTMTFQAKSMHSDLMAGLIEFFWYCTLRLLALMFNAISVFFYNKNWTPNGFSAIFCTMNHWIFLIDIHNIQQVLVVLVPKTNSGPNWASNWAHLGPNQTKNGFSAIMST